MRKTGVDMHQQPEQNRIGKFLLIILAAVIAIGGSGQTFAGGGPNVTGAKLYIQNNDLDRAIEVLTKEVRDVNSRNEEAWYLLGYIYARQSKYEQMLEAFNKAVELKPKLKKKGVKISKDNEARFHSKQGVTVILTRVWADEFNFGIKNYNEAIKSTDDSLRKANYEKAVANFKAAALIQPDSSLAYRNWAAALLNAGRTEDSIEPLQLSLQRNPDNVEVKTMLANVYLNSGNDSLAVPVFEELWNSGVQTEEISDNLSRAYIRSGQLDKAKSVYKTAIETNPNSFHFRYNYGTILLESQEFDQAIEQLDKAHEIDPESADINYNLGAAYLNRGVYKREKLTEGSEDKAYLEDFENAFPFLEKSIKMKPDDFHAWFTLGRIAGQLNKIALAGYAFSKGEPTESILDDKVILGMPIETLKNVLGAPDLVKPVESTVFGNVEEWGYDERKGSKTVVSIPEPIKVYVAKGLVDALMVEK